MSLQDTLTKQAVVLLVFSDLKGNLRLRERVATQLANWLDVDVPDFDTSEVSEDETPRPKRKLLCRFGHQILFDGKTLWCSRCGVTL